jgi:hypothetical protein
VSGPRVRQLSEALCQPLEIEDYGVQSMADVSPPKWHLAHTTWFCENFILKRLDKSYEPFRNEFQFLFNRTFITPNFNFDFTPFTNTFNIRQYHKFTF